VLEAAVSLADAGGIESLTMRRLAQEVGVEAMTLYYYVANKDEILNGIVDMVVSEIELPPSGDDWRTALRRSAISAHEILVRHPWSASLVLSGGGVSAARLRLMDAILGTLRGAGFSADMTDHAYHALDSHITGFTLWQVSMPFDTREELVDLAEAFLQETSADEYPYVVEHAEQHMGPSAPEGKTEFEFGLDLILDGLERLRDAQEGGRTAS
jgi:AcrR family transcriptional regulator